MSPALTYWKMHKKAHVTTTEKIFFLKQNYQTNINIMPSDKINLSQSEKYYEANSLMKPGLVSH